MAFAKSGWFVCHSLTHGFACNSATFKRSAVNCSLPSSLPIMSRIGGSAFPKFVMRWAAPAPPLNLVASSVSEFSLAKASPLSLHFSTTSSKTVWMLCEVGLWLSRSSNKIVTRTLSGAWLPHRVHVMHAHYAPPRPAFRFHVRFPPQKYFHSDLEEA